MSQSELRRYFWLLFAGVVVLHLGSGVGIYTLLGSWAERGQFGDMFGAANALFTGLALAVVLYAVVQLSVMQKQLSVTQEQLTDARQWNRMNFTFTQLRMAEVLSPIEAELNKSWVKLIDRTTPLNPDELDRLFSDAEVDTRALLRTFVNEIERFAAAVNLGLADDQLARRLYEYKLTRHFVELRPYIQRLRELQNAPTVLKDLEDLVRKWQPAGTTAPVYGGTGGDGRKEQ